MLTKLCPHCRKIIPYESKYCADCKPKVAAQADKSRGNRAKDYDTKRDKSMRAFYYSKAWKDLSKTLLQKSNYLCEICQKNIATEAHHKIHIDTSEGWEERFNSTHIVSLCTQCHNAQHKRFCRQSQGVGG